MGTKGVLSFLTEDLEIAKYQIKHALEDYIYSLSEDDEIVEADKKFQICEELLRQLDI